MRPLPNFAGEAVALKLQGCSSCTKCAFLYAQATETRPLKDEFPGVPVIEVRCAMNANRRLPALMYGHLYNRKVHGKNGDEFEATKNSICAKFYPLGPSLPQLADQRGKLLTYSGPSERVRRIVEKHAKKQR